MPILIRLILQRILVFGTATLAFLGINPEVDIPTIEESQIKIEERKEVIVETIISPKEASEPIIDISKIITKTDNKTQLEEVEPIPIQTNIPEQEDFFDINIVEEITDTAEKIKSEIENLSEENTVAKEDTIIETKISNNIDDVSLNIICVNKEGNRIEVSTGSGTIISSNGVVLTNAHVAQNFLLKDYPKANYMDCSLYRENLTIYGYKARILYISNQWIEDNYYLIKSLTPTGTGENDYALLAITGSTNPAIRISSSFPYTSFSISDSDFDEGDSIVLAGYPGQRGGLFTINQSGTLLIDDSFIEDVFTFSRSTIDLLTTGESPVAARGASGGGVFKNDKLIGVISTVASGRQYNKANAITTSYINRDLRNDYGESLNSLINGDVKSKAESFENTKGDGLRELLSKGL